MVGEVREPYKVRQMESDLVCVQEHYEKLLADRYSWMFGSFETRTAQQYTLFSSHGIEPRLGGLALDLGSGPGFQSIALAQVGFRVTAVDVSERLLNELEERRGNFPIDTVRSDLRDLSRFSDASFELVVCLGDTLTHLPQKEDIPSLLRDVDRILEPGGRLAIDFRDLTQELRGLDRFIPVRSDPDRIMTCVLEYEPETVLVHDLVYERNGPNWDFRKSCYSKIRLAPNWVCAQLEEIGLKIDFHEVKSGFHVIGSTKSIR